MQINEKNRLYVWIGILLIVSLVMGVIFNNILFPNYNVEEENDFPNWLALVVEIIIGIGIALIIYDHTKKIESRELEDLEMAIRGTYYSIWNLYHAMLPYSKSDQVRSDRISGLQILSVLQTVRNTLSKCAQRIDGTKIETIQVDLLEVQEIVRSSIDPRAEIEDLWSQNSTRFTNAMNEIRKIAEEDFESFIPNSSKAQWPES